MSSTGVAVVGGGYWGANIIRTLADMNRLAAVCDTNPAAGKVAAEKYGVPYFPTLDALLKERDIHAVAIATPAHTHAQVIEAALEAGKDVFVEKPITLDMASARHVSARADALGRVLMVGHLLRYHPVFEALQAELQSGMYGKLRYVYSNRLNIGKLRAEEDVLWSFAPHDISMVLALAGSAPTHVRARSSAILRPDIADVVVLEFGFGDGVAGHIFVSWLNAFKEQKLVAIADKAMFVFDDTLPWNDKLMRYPHEIQGPGNDLTAVKKDGIPVAVPQAQPLRRELEHFISCVTDRSRPRTDTAEALRVLDVLVKAQDGMHADRVREAG